MSPFRVDVGCLFLSGCALKEASFYGAKRKCVCQRAANTSAYHTRDAAAPCLFLDFSCRLVAPNAQKKDAAKLRVSNAKGRGLVPDRRSSGAVSRLFSNSIEQRVQLSHSATDLNRIHRSKSQ